MKEAQQVFDNIQKSKKEEKEIRTIYKDILANNSEYVKLIDEFDSLKARKKQIEDGAKAEMNKEYARMERLKQEIKSSKELLSDIAVSAMMKGRPVEIKDNDEHLYEARYSVSFKKTSVRANSGHPANNENEDKPAFVIPDKFKE